MKKMALAVLAAGVLSGCSTIVNIGGTVTTDQAYKSAQPWIDSGGDADQRSTNEPAGGSVEATLPIK